MGKKGGAGKKGGNKGVGLDFKKVKTKVGKKLPKAQNETDTTIHARSIHLPMQSGILDDKAGVAVTRRNLSIKELLQQCGHYADKTRRDALHGLSELLETHPDELAPNLALVLEKVAERAADQDKDVRKALTSLWTDRLLPLLHPNELRPFLPLVMAHLCKALTHIAPEVRSDALPLLAALLDKAASDVLRGGYLETILEHFCDILGRRASANLGGRSLKVLCKSLEGLEGFLMHAERVYAGATATTSTATEEEEGSTCAHMHASLSSVMFPPKLDLARSLEALQAAVLPKASTVTATTTTQAKMLSVEGPAEPLCRLLPLLLEAWLEASPGSLATAPESLPTQALQLALVCLRRCVAVLAALGHTDLALVPALEHKGGEEATVEARTKSGKSASSSAPAPSATQDPRSSKTSLAEVLTAKLPLFFPLGVPAVKPDREAADRLVSMNLDSARLLAACVPTSLPPTPAAAKWIHKLSLFYLGVIEDGTVLAAPDAMSETTKAFPAGPDAYQVALEGTLGVIGAVGEDVRLRLLQSIATLAARSSVRSQERALCVQLMLRVIQNPVEFCGSGLVPESVLCAWLTAMPKMLWELANKKPAVSLDLLRCLHCAATLAPPGSHVAATVQSLQLQLCPLFLARVPQQGSANVRVVFGPLSKLPPQCQFLAADLVQYLGPPSDALLQVAVTAAMHPASPYALSTVSRLLQAVLSCDVAVLGPERAVRLLASLVLGVEGDEGEEEEGGNLELVDVACRAMDRGGYLLPGLMVVLKPVLQGGEGAVTVRRRRGALRAIQFALAAHSDLPLDLTAGLPSLWVQEALSCDVAASSQPLMELLLNYTHALGPTFLEACVRTLRDAVTSDLTTHSARLPALFVLLLETCILDASAGLPLMQHPAFKSAPSLMKELKALCEAATGTWCATGKNRSTLAQWASEEARDKTRVAAERLMAALRNVEG